MLLSFHVKAHSVFSNLSSLCNIKHRSKANCGETAIAAINIPWLLPRSLSCSCLPLLLAGRAITINFASITATEVDSDLAGIRRTSISCCDNNGPIPYFAGLFLALEIVFIVSSVESGHFCQSRDKAPLCGQACQDASFALPEK